MFGKLHVLPAITAFLKAYPDIDIRLIQSDRIVDLPEEHIDLAVRIGVLKDSSLAVRNVGSIRRVLCASPAYIRERGLPEAPGELIEHDCVSFETLTNGSRWIFRHGSSEAQVDLHPRLVVNTAEAAIEAAIAGLGITRVLSYQVADAIARHHLTKLMEDYEDAPWPVSLVYPKRGSIPKKVRVFIDFVSDHLKRRLAALP